MILRFELRTVGFHLLFHAGSSLLEDPGSARDELDLAAGEAQMLPAPRLDAEQQRLLLCPGVAGATS